MPEPAEPRTGDGAAQTIGEILTGQRIMAILRNRPVPEAVRLAGIAWDVGIELVEVTIQTPDAIPELKGVLAAAKDRGKTVGVGSVTTIEQVDLAERLGAAFTVAPGLDIGVLKRSEALGLPHLPGVATATEIQCAVANGATWLKAFPANTLGVSWFRSIIGGPFPDVCLVATGGLNAWSATDYLNAGASMVGVGSALEDEAQLRHLARLLA